MPVPKAGSTAILWELIELTGLGNADFETSVKLETTRALTVHDMSIWGEDYRLEARSALEANRLFESPEWLAFAFVRDPVRRIWSAWTSKVLLREPRFVAAYGDEDWFPEVGPASTQEIVTAFRRFVQALSERPDGWGDRHWTPQADLLGIGGLRYGLVGRVEDLPGALAPVDAHLRARGGPRLSLGRVNPTFVPFVPEVLDRRAWDQCAELTVRDRKAFGYELVEWVGGSPKDDWTTLVETLLPAIHAVIERNDRIGDLERRATRSRLSARLRS